MRLLRIVHPNDNISLIASGLLQFIYRLLCIEVKNVVQYVNINLGFWWSLVFLFFFSGSLFGSLVSTDEAY